MSDTLSSYQAKLHIAVFQGAIYLLLFAIALATIRTIFVGDWPSLLRVIIYSMLAVILALSQRKLQQFPNNLLAQRLGMGAILVGGAALVALVTEELWGIGVIVMAIGLFFVALGTNRADAQRWLFTAVVLFLLAFTARQQIAILRLDYRIDLLLTLYLYPPFSFWICMRIGSGLVRRLSETMAMGQDLEADLRHQELRYQQLIESMNEGFVVANEHEQFVYVNNRFCEIFGYERSELLNRRNDEVLCLDELNLQVLQQETQLRTAKLRSTYELSARRKDGTPVHLLVSAVPNFDKDNRFRGSFCVVMDITERKHAEESLRADRSLLSARIDERTASLHTATMALQKELRERTQIEVALRKAEEEYRTLFNTVPIGIYRASLDGRQLRANPALAALNGYDSETEMLEAVQTVAADWYVDPQRRAEFQKQLLDRQGVRNFESEVYRHKSREQIWVSESATLVMGQDGEALYYRYGARYH
ncbi:MAG: PAS domain S-box protein [Caldilineaceae bacterium]